jgi:hypothetical protein
MAMVYRGRRNGGKKYLRDTLMDAAIERIARN